MEQVDGVARRAQPGFVDPESILTDLPLRLTRLHQDFGCRVDGIDLRQPLAGAIVAALRQAFEVHSVLVFADQAIDTEQQVAFAERFGPVDIVKVGSVGAGTRSSAVGNIGKDGNLVEPDSRLWLVARANQLWHSDGSFRLRPPMASLLSARVVPPLGGETEFVSMRAVWRLLPRELKQRIDGAAAIHSYAASRDRIHPGLMTAEERRALPPVCHPMIRVNRKTGERALFIGSHVSHIQGMPTGESRGLLDTLMDFATAERFIYRHCWRQHDLILWDNRAVIHRGRPWDMGHHPRHLVHVSVMDDELPPQPADGPAA